MTKQEHIGSVAVGDGRDTARKQIEEAIAAQWGDRCPDFDAGCACCQTWAEYDRLSARPAQEPVGPITELQDFCLRYLLPEPYKATYASSGNPSYDNPTEHHSEVQRHRMIWRRDRAFISDVIHVLDTTPRHAPATPHPLHTTNCCKCGRIIDTREKKDGGDDFGAQLNDGRWTCSIECDDAVINPTHSQGAGTTGLLTDPAPADRLQGRVEQLEAALAAEEARNEELLKRLDKAREGKDPDFCYDPDEWEFTSDWEDRDQVHGHGEALKPGEPMQVATLIRGPRKWVAEVPVTWTDDGDPDETEVRWFDTEGEALAAFIAPASEGSAE